MFVTAKKSLGQNFLRSKSALGKIVDAADLKKDDTVLEVGPGEGILTRRLLDGAGKVVAVEKDDGLISLLREKFSGDIASGKLILVHSDILDFDPKPNTLNEVPTSYKLVANIPYYITGKFLRKFLSGASQPSRMVLLLQKEVVDRIVARNGKESLLSLSVKAFGHPRVIARVSADAFRPKPKVDSAILLIENISHKLFKNSEEELNFFKIIHAGFAHKRKKLTSNLKAALRIDLADTFSKCGIHENSRSEDLLLTDWLCLNNQLSTQTPAVVTPI